MKKLLMVLAAVAIATGVNASAVSWKLTTGTAYTGTAYAFVNTSTADILSACAKTDASAWDTLFADAAVGTTSGTGARTVSQGINTGVSAGDSLVWVIVDGSVEAGSTYTVFNAKDITAGVIYEPPASPTSTMSFKATDLSVAGTGSFSSVPEPTSGLLLLLGMAGLALKRKQA